MSGSLYVTNATAFALTLPDYANPSGQELQIPANVTDYALSLLLTTTGLQLACPAVAAFSSNAVSVSSVTLAVLLVSADLMWQYAAPYAAGTFAVISIDASANAITIRPFNAKNFSNASSQWVGVSPGVGVFQPAANATVPLMPYAPFAVLAQGYGDKGGVVCEISFDCVGNANNADPNPQWLQCITGVEPTEYYAQLVPGVQQQEYVLMQANSNPSYFCIGQSQSNGLTKLSCTPNVRAAAIVYVSIALSGGTVLLFEDPVEHTFWVMDAGYFCFFINENTGYYKDVYLMPAASNTQVDVFTLPGFAIDSTSLTAPIANALTLHPTTLYNCFMPVEVGCPDASSACLFYDTALGSTTCKGPPTAANLAQVSAFIQDVCYGYDSSCDCTGTPATTRACALACTSSKLNLSSVCVASSSSFCDKHSSAIQCGGSGPHGSSSHNEPVPAPSSLPPTSATGPPFWVWIIVGVVVVLVIAIVVTLVLKRRRSKTNAVTSNAVIANG